METFDKTDWGDGPWQDEPDLLEYVDETTGYRCLVGRAEGGGHLCGYVGIQPGHPCHGKEFRELDLQAHGGVNFARPSRNDETYWIGFDCGHSWDFGPGLRTALMSIAPEFLKTIQLGLIKKDQNYRTLDYVKDHIASLAKQLKALETE